jgi:hypothetical protein
LGVAVVLYALVWQQPLLEAARYVDVTLLVLRTALRTARVMRITIAGGLIIRFFFGPLRGRVWEKQKQTPRGTAIRSSSSSSS